MALCLGHFFKGKGKVMGGYTYLRRIKYWHKGFKELVKKRMIYLH